MQGISAHSRALAIRKEIGDASGIAESMNNLGVLNSRCGQRKEAVVLFSKCVDAMKEARNLAGQTQCLLNAGAVLADMGEFGGWH